MSEDPYYLIPRSHLPEAVRKAAEVTELLQRNPGMSVTEGVKRTGISRSVYYKYKDVVRPFHAAMENQIVTFAFTLFHVSGVLSHVLNLFAQWKANLLTIHQSIPLQGVATVVLTTETRGMTSSLDEVLDELRRVDGVRDVYIVGQE